MQGERTRVLVLAMLLALERDDDALLQAALAMSSEANESALQPPQGQGGSASQLVTDAPRRGVH